MPGFESSAVSLKVMEDTSATFSFMTFPLNTKLMTSSFNDSEAAIANVVWGNNYTVDATGVASATREWWLTKDGGDTWTNGIVTGSPAGYRVSNIWPIDSMTCYVAMYNGTGTGLGGN